MNIFPFKNRSVQLDKPVEIYRCLNRKGKIYSIRQRGVVVAHTDNITIKNCTFVVNEAGKKKAIETSERNVHAFIRGFIEKRFRANSLLTVKYNPFSTHGFLCVNRGSISKARYVVIDRTGVKAKL